MACSIALLLVACDDEASKGQATESSAKAVAADESAESDDKQGAASSRSGERAEASDEPEREGQEESASDTSYVPDNITSVVDAGACKVEALQGEGSSDDFPRWSAGNSPDVIRVEDTGFSGLRILRQGDLGPFAIVEYLYMKGDTLRAGMPVPTRALWKVDCQSPGDMKPFARMEGVDFGRSVVDWDRGLLYAAGTGGVVALDLESGDTTRVTELPDTKESPQGGDCWMRDRPYTPIDIPLYVDPAEGRLVVKRGGPCGYEAAWEYRVHQVDLTDDGRGVDSERQAHLPTSLAKDADGTIWLADGARRSLHYGVSHAADGLVRSTDGGETWEPVGTSKPSEKAGEPEGPVSVSGEAVALADSEGDKVNPWRVVASTEQAGRLLLVGHPYVAGGVGHRGGHFLYSDDGGDSWWPVRQPEGEDLAVWAVESTDGSLGKLRLWTVPQRELDACTAYVYGEEETPSCPVDKLTLWTTDNGGGSWTKSSETPEPPAAALSLEGKDGVELKIERSAGRVVRGGTTIFPTPDD